MADRELCESNIDAFLKEAEEKDIALLVVGDPLGATTHTDMLLRAKDLGVKTQVCIILNKYRLSFHLHKIRYVPKIVFLVTDE